VSTSWTGHTEVETRTVRVGRRRWVVETTWQGRGESRHWGITQTRVRRVGWEQGRWTSVWGTVQQVQHGWVVR
jgi:hypothetical protein